MNKLQFLDIGSELPDIQEPVEPLEIYGAASIRAKMETTFTGSVVLETKIVGRINKQYVVCGGIYKAQQGSIFISVIPCSVPCHLVEDIIFCRAERVQLVYKLVSTDFPLVSNHQTNIS